MEAEAHGGRSAVGRAVPVSNFILALAEWLRIALKSEVIGCARPCHGLKSVVEVVGGDRGTRTLAADAPKHASKGTVHPFQVAQRSPAEEDDWQTPASHRDFRGPSTCSARRPIRDDHRLRPRTIALDRRRSGREQGICRGRPLER
jgi:hypothetical protein